jgi:hypothetical protein
MAENMGDLKIASKKWIKNKRQKGEGIEDFHRFFISFVLQKIKFVFK